MLLLLLLLFVAAAIVAVAAAPAALVAVVVAPSANAAFCSCSYCCCCCCSCSFNSCCCCSCFCCFSLLLVFFLILLLLSCGSFLVGLLFLTFVAVAVVACIELQQTFFLKEYILSFRFLACFMVRSFLTRVLQRYRVQCWKRDNHWSRTNGEEDGYFDVVYIEERGGSCSLFEVIVVNWQWCQELKSWGEEKSSVRFLEALIGQKRKGGEHHTSEEGR